MEDLLPLIVFLLFVSGGGCALTGTWWSKRKKEKQDTDEPQS